MLTLIWTFVTKAMTRHMPDVRRRLIRYAARLRNSIVVANSDRPVSSHVDLTPPRHAYPRRARCGLSLFEALLVILIAVPITQQGVRLAEDYIRQQSGVQESRLLTQVVTAASTFALRDLNARIIYTVGVGNVQVLTLGDLEERGAWVSPNARTALGRDIEVIFYARDVDELVVLARALTPDGEEAPSYTPRGGIGIGLVGTIREETPAILSGPGLEYNLSALQAQATAQLGRNLPVAGDHLALAVLRMDQDVLPFLHRKHVDGHPEVNRMQTDLDMGGFDLVGVGELEAGLITVQNGMEIGEITGTLEVDGNINAGGDLTIPGTLTSAEVEIDGQITANRLDVSGLAQFSDVEAENVSTREMRIQSAIGTIQAGVVTSPKIEIERLVAENIVTGSCTGCK